MLFSVKVATRWCGSVMARSAAVITGGAPSQRGFPGASDGRLINDVTGRPACSPAAAAVLCFAVRVTPVTACHGTGRVPPPASR